MKRILDEAFLQDTVSSMIDMKEIHSAVIRVENGDGSLALTAAAGDMKTMIDTSSQASQNST